ncbi:hypothetical protein Aph01nite_11410 [Acrocarpospora phusangensis]|uniref:Calcium-binding protein n=1 Tax=Acrocarpospora phusangensis TaxID=1070424 RepID=A0A919UIM1_9ACTN|nr:hypothetical protein [Acrocarpospora phusangensis]GIH22831.1 hypothetical protein Aph01nite_11410 [Acrocarpospora phusangensis]
MRIRKNLARLSLLAVTTTMLAGALATPGHAAGATVQVTSVNGVPELRYTGTGSAETVTLTQASRLVIVESSGALTALAGCSLDSLNPRRATCDSAGQPVINLVRLDLDGGSDVARIQNSRPVETIVSAGAGNDTYLGGQSSASSRVLFNGGEGTDTADYSAGTSGVLVDIDSAADDGRPASGDTDTIFTTVENLIGTRFNDSLRGNNSANVITSQGGGDSIRAGGGNDTVNAAFRSADIELNCGTGTGDVLTRDAVEDRDAIIVSCEN